MSKLDLRTIVLISGRLRKVWHLLNMILIYGGNRSVEGGTGWYLVVLGQYRAVQVDIWCWWVSMKRNWLIHDNTGQYWLVFGGWWVSMGRYWLVFGGTGYKAFMPVYIEKSGDLVRCYHTGTTTNDKRKRKDRATQPMDHGRLRWAIKEC